MNKELLLEYRKIAVEVFNLDALGPELAAATALIAIADQLARMETTLHATKELLEDHLCGGAA